MARAYYNENDPFAAAWLRELIKDNLICPGYVDERSIEEVKSEDLSDYTQHHWFAGIGTWSYSLRCAGWSDDRPVWTGSCPCQPFSAAGKRKGFGDKRHLWPTWFRLIREYRPDTIFGEQVASKDALTWFDTVSADLEREGYAIGALDTCAASVGAPHIRQRLYFVADSRRERGARWRNVRDMGEAKIGNKGKSGQRERLRNTVDDSRTDGFVADSSNTRRPQEGKYGSRPPLFPSRSPERSGIESVVNAESEQVGVSGCTREPRTADIELGQSVLAGLEGLSGNGDESNESGRHREEPDRPTSEAGATNGFWADAIGLPCRDGKARPTKPGIQPLAHGTPNRVGTLRGAGNSIVAPQAQAFIESYLEVIGT